MGLTPEWLVVAAVVGSALCRVYERCELMRELSDPRHRIPQQDLATWICIARHESQYNTSAVGHLNADGSGDHGLFQISDQYWCSPPGVGLSCGLNCDQLEDDNIKDDVICARRIYRATKRRTGDGFTAWAVYGPHCSGDVSSYLEGCEDQEEEISEETNRKTLLPSSEESSKINLLNQQPTSGFIPLSGTLNNQIREITTKPTINLVATRRSLSSSPKQKASFSNSAMSQGKPSTLKLNETPAKVAAFTPSSTSEMSSSSSSSSSRTHGTSSIGPRPTTTSVQPVDPSTAWLRIHNDPRFLDEFH